MNTKKKYIAPALNLFMVQAEVGYAGSKFLSLFDDNAEDPGYTNNQEHWQQGSDDNWSTGSSSWDWAD